jgi:hypothetical protein
MLGEGQKPAQRTFLTRLSRLIKWSAIEKIYIIEEDIFDADDAVAVVYASASENPLFCTLHPSFSTFLLGLPSEEDRYSF